METKNWKWDFSNTITQDNIDEQRLSSLRMIYLEKITVNYVFIYTARLLIVCSWMSVKKNLYRATSTDSPKLLVLTLFQINFKHV